MNSRAILYFLNLEIDLIKVTYAYKRPIFRHNGMPRAIVNGGKLRVEFQTDQRIIRLLEEMTSDYFATYGKTATMPKAKVGIHDANGYIIRTHNHLDVIIQRIKNIFISEGETPMMSYVVFTIGVQNYGTKHTESWNISDSKPSPYKTPVIATEKEEDFQLKIKHLNNKKTFVPFGIPAFSGTLENKNIEFEIEVSENNIDEFIIEILQDNNVIYSIKSGEEDLPNNYKVGKHTFKWDGFDSNGIYDSTLFTTGKLKARIKGKRNGKEKTAESSEFTFEYKEVNWVDTKIDKNAKRIDITLRVNLKDSGENGTEKECYELGKSHHAPIIKICPWDKIPKKNLTHGTPIKTRTKKFKDLEKLALDGLNYHWGRNQNHFIAKNVDINGEKYELYVNAINTTEKTMDDVSLIFNTNKSWMRSGNPGTVEDPISFIGNIVSREAICYNVGYIKYSNGWGYKTEINENVELKDTSAHEIGHTILKAYGGTFYSYGHKGSVNTITQKLKSSAPKIPMVGEIDIMPYYNDNMFGNEYYQKDYHKRRVASKKDILSLIWLTKIILL